MTSERERLSKLMEEMAKGNAHGANLRFSPKSKKVEPTFSNPFYSRYDPDPDGQITINNTDGILSASNEEYPGQIVILQESLTAMDPEAPTSVSFRGNWNEMFFSLMDIRNSKRDIPGTILVTKGTSRAVEAFGREDDLIRVLIPHASDRALSLKEISKQAKGWVRDHGAWKELPLQIVPMKIELFSRHHGLLETDALADKRVAIFGLGSVGSQVAVDLAKSGVTYYQLVDFDRLEVCNVVRHHCGLSDVGRLKIDAVADSILEKNPYATIDCYPLKVDWDQYDQVKKNLADADLCIIATDNQRSRLVINKAAVEAGVTCIAGGAYRRAYGGHVLRIRPGQTCCYQCFTTLLPERAADQEISNEEQAEAIAYSDRAVSIEPGLSTDIAPISLMMIKLAIQELLQGRQTTLGSLNEDLSASWYLWLNRREIGSQFENLKPLKNKVDGMHVLRWYGIDIQRHPGCPVCGDFRLLFEDPDLESSLQQLGRLKEMSLPKAEQ